MSPPIKRFVSHAIAKLSETELTIQSKSPPDSKLRERESDRFDDLTEGLTDDLASDPADEPVHKAIIGKFQK